jgi:acyl-CoA reductase-like NAD-dependent aldehyde dehydrogenase
MPDDQSVADMVDEILARQAAYRASQTGESFEEALEAVIETVAGGQLQELRSGPHRRTRADEWQTTVASERARVLREARRSLAEHLAPSLKWR